MADPEGTQIRVSRDRLMPPGPAYDLAIATLGYERRATYVTEKCFAAARQSYALAFRAHRRLSFERNRGVFKRLGTVIDDALDEAAYPARIQGLIADVGAQTEGEITLGFDVSSASRSRIGAFLAVVEDWVRTTGRGATVDLWYAPAEFSPPPLMSEAMQQPVPVVPELSGRQAPPTIPLCLIMGLGYEPDRAMGVFELLEPDRALLFSPLGIDEEYQVEIKRVNADLLTSNPMTTVVGYPVADPPEIFFRLESACFAMSTTHRLAVVPFGPKIFAAIAMLVAFSHNKAHAVWRVSPGEWSEPRESLPHGDVVGLRFTWRPSPSPPNR